MKTAYLRIVFTLLAILSISFLANDVYQSLPSDKVKILTGPVGGSFYKTALEYKKVLEQRGFKVELEPVTNTA